MEKNVHKAKQTHTCLRLAPHKQIMTFHAVKRKKDIKNNQQKKKKLNIPKKFYKNLILK